MTSNRRLSDNGRSGPARKTVGAHGVRPMSETRTDQDWPTVPRLSCKSYQSQSLCQELGSAQSR